MAETDIPNWLNSSFFETALKSAGYGPNVTVTSSEIGRATAAGENYISDIFRAKLQLTLDGHRSTLSLIVKTLPEEGGKAKVNILFCLMLHLLDNPNIVNSNTLYIDCYILRICHTYTRFTNK